MYKRLTQALAALSLVLLAAYVFAQTRKDDKRSSVEQMIAQLSTVRTIGEVAISPDGMRVAWATEPAKSPSHPGSSSSAIYVADLTTASAGTHPRSEKIASRKLTAGAGAYDEQSISWSPDSKTIAFLSDKAKPGQLQLWVAPAAGGTARRLTSLTGFLGDPRWSPDGKAIAILFTENAPRASGPLQPATIQTGVIEDHVYEQRLTTVDVSSGRVRQLSPADLYVYEYDWSADSRAFAAIAAHGDGDDNWYIAELWTVAADSGETKSILKPSMQIAVPRWSPDGKTIAFIGGLMSDEGVTGGDIYTIPAAGGEARNVTPGMKMSASWLAWSSNQILFTAHVDGQSGIATVDSESGRLTDVWRSAEVVSGDAGTFSLSVARDGRQSALIRHSFQQPPEVWAGAISSWKQITRLNQGLRPSWGAARSVHWTNDGFNVQGWLLYPRDYDSSRRYPMIVVVHGGPSSAVRPAWPGTFFNTSGFSNQGYFVFLPNPRGSYGQGEAFTQANVKDFGYGDLRDILAGVDEVTRTLPVDKDRLGITGWSYGGFMTMWAVTQTDRFRAAVAGAGIANWQSYYGENGIDKWMIPFFGASVYDDPAVYAKSAPINFVKNVKTPTLILVGDRDIECPTPQSYEYWHALKTLGVTTQLAVYESEGHHIAKPEHRLDIIKRSLAWFNEHLQVSSHAAPR
jgi:dipeptidyl aminopeptidase/acylaminoacyl peptidase